MKTTPLPLSYDPARLRYRHIIGTGGIGSGRMFALQGNHTLGREESRAGRFTNSRDYCKLHIIAHYLAVLLGPNVTVLPVGAVGDDGEGAGLLEEMREAGLDLTYVRQDLTHPTLSCICLIYPDGSGGNFTVDDSASAQVSAEQVTEAIDGLGGDHPAVVVAVPEVPLAARTALLSGARPGDLRAASFLSEEMAVVRTHNVLADVDVLAINLDEATALAELSGEQSPERVLAGAWAVARNVNPTIVLSVTGGGLGSWLTVGGELFHQPAHEVTIGTTAGAGDAHLSGLLAGLALGLPSPQAHELAALVAAAAVTGPHTINFDLGRELLAELGCSAASSAAVRALIVEQR
ncbi:MAG: hypothetical protein HN742_17650 [Lentisphaerae bacterium]|nr:hypothetical protein [Lentisphaerota bacterium]MBT5611940.1 hypothetical protein [Lentisphaerota bacterium]MBT7057906.1 hypothetical protein [Lentisphaerota bacterium]MBT7843707.1 hypothetical protein [Lentisphaerota bacterium]